MDFILRGCPEQWPNVKHDLFSLSIVYCIFFIYDCFAGLSAWVPGPLAVRVSCESRCRTESLDVWVLEIPAELARWQPRPGPHKFSAR